MNKLSYLFGVLFFFAIFFPASEGRYFLLVDDLAEKAPGFTFQVVLNEPDGYWWNPYAYQPNRRPEGVFWNTAGALGGQRDIIVGWEGFSGQGTTCVVNIVTVVSNNNQRRADSGMSLGFVGGVYWQYDGLDYTGTPGVVGSAPTVMPGALFSPTPGLGAFTGHSPAKPERNGDGQTYDFTSGGQAIGIEISVTADWNVFYYIDVIDSLGFNNSMEFLPEQDVESVFQFRFSDPNWVTNKGSAFDWTDIAGIQVRIWVFSDEENPGGQDSQAVDTQWWQLRTFGYEIAGLVDIDCDCNGANNTPRQNEEVTIALAATPSVILDTRLTDSAGLFSFTGDYMDVGQYVVCVSNTGVQICQGTPRCQTVTVNSIENPISLTFSLIIQATISGPPDIQLDCGECVLTDLACTGSATLVDCSGANVPVTQFQDSPPQGSCLSSSFVRTFTAQGLTVTQTITVVDNLPPTITTPASNANVECPNTANPTFTNWLASHAGAVASDCNAITWTNDHDGSQPNCGAVTVTFTASDVCGNSAPSSLTTATYTMQDSTPPTISTPATSPTVSCTTTGSDVQQFQTWLASNGGASATDNCGTLGPWTNDYTGGPISSGCQSVATVRFFIEDTCGNTAFTDGTFTIEDTAGPSITRQAVSQTMDCSAGDATSAFNNWLSTNGGALATDACTAPENLSWSNSGGAAPVGCNGVTEVTFTVLDDCSNSATTTATFTVFDRTPPTINPQASPLVLSCESSSTGTEFNDWLSNNGGAAATDACSTVSWSNQYTQLPGNCQGVPVTFTATDLCSNQAVTTATYSISDTQAPSVVVGPQTVECASYTPDAFTAWLNSATATDNCAAPDEITISNNYQNPSPPAPGCDVVTPVTWTASDICGNRSPGVTATFTITDSQGPVLTAPAVDESQPCGAAANSAYTAWLGRFGGATATDSCSGVTWSHNGSATPQGGCDGSTPVTFTARDTCGFTVETTATFSISDTVAPVITTPASPLAEECNQSGSSQLNSWLASNGRAVATDNCSPVTWTNNFVPTTGGNCGSQVVVEFTASDACGYTAVTTATYSSGDSQPPIVTPARDTSAPCNAETQNELMAWALNHGGATATDACWPVDQLTWQVLNVPPILACNFVELTFTVSDPCGNSASTTARFTSTDSTPPSFNPPATDAQVECDGSGNAVAYQQWLDNHAGAVPVDDCAVNFFWSHNGPAEAPRTCGAVTVTFSVVDTCDNTGRTTATFRVVDTQGPTFTAPPVDAREECDGSGNREGLAAWLANNAGAQATDICTTTDLVWSNAAGTPTSPDGCEQYLPYTFTVRDSCGNTNALTANFILGDSTPPEWECPVEDVEFECDGFGNEGQIQGWLNNNGGGHVVDLCHGEDITWTNNFVGPVPMCSSVTVNFIATDPCGNSVQDSGVVAIVDTLDPVWSFFPEDVTLPCDADVAVEVLGAALATDVCSGDLFVSMTETEFDEPADGDCPGDHIITRTWSTADDCGNTITRDQVITIQIIRSSGPCNPENCVCDDCCPPPAPADCLPADCSASDCARVPCNSAPCSCGRGKVEVDSDAEDSIAAYDAKYVESLPQCKPVYIYVNDDDDSEQDADATGLERQRMLVTNEPLHESVLKSKSDASSLSYSVFALVFAMALFFF